MSAPGIPSGEELENMWVSIAAGRSGYDLVMKRLGPWLASALNSVATLAPPEFVHELWSLLGVDDLDRTSIALG